MATWARNIFGRLLHSLSFKLSLSVGIIIFVTVALGAYVEVQRQYRQSRLQMREQAEGFAETVRRATYWSMLRNQRQSLHRIIRDMASQPGVLRIRVFNKEGAIMFSSARQEIGTEVDKRAEACFGCHAQDRPLTRLPSSERTRIFRGRDGSRVMGTILPIYNEPACSSAPCHAHPPQQRVLGVLDVDLSLAALDRRLGDDLWRTLAFALALFLGVSTLIGLAIIATVNRSVHRLVTEVDKVAAGDLDKVEAVRAPDELDQIARAFNRMARSVARRAHLKKRRYRQLVHNSTDAVILMDRRGRVLMANPEAGSILGREPHRLEGRDAGSLVHPRDLPLLKKTLAQALAGPKPSDMVSFRVRADNGQTRVLEGRFRRLEGEEGEEGLLANLRDISERRALEAELSRRREFERRLIQQALNAIVATDEKGVIQVFNHSAEELLDIQAPQVVGKLEYKDFFPRAQVRVLSRSLFDNPRQGASLVRPAVVATSGGKRLPVMLSARVMFMQDRFSGVMFFLQNLRESKALKAQLLRKTRLAAVGQTAAGLAHCMKNLLHGLGTATYLVDQGMEEKDLDLARQGWSMVRKNLNQLEELTQDLLAYAKDRRPEYQVFNLNQTLYQCVSFVMGRAREQGVAIEVAPDPSCDRVMLDPLGMRRVLLNLLSNALDALQENPPPGNETPTITLKSGRDGYGQVWVSVADNGPGLPAEVKRQLFTRIFSSKGSKGTGLGLLVCQKIAEEHGGAIDCANLPGRGVRFTISVPDLSEQRKE